MMNKKNLPHIFMVVSLVVFIVLGLACSSTPRPTAVQSPQEKTENAEKNSAGTWQNVGIPAKDFQSLGLVFYVAETTEIFETNARGSTSVESTIQGETFMYYKLLEKAKELGADAIVNVTIDKITTKRRIKEETRTNLVTEDKWFATALAIKYTDAIR